MTIPRCYKDVYVNSFFPCIAKLWSSLPVGCFPLTYDLSGFKCRINRHLFKSGFPTGVANIGGRGGGTPQNLMGGGGDSSQNRGGA